MSVQSGVIERPKITINGAVLAVEKLNDLIDLRVESTVSRPAQATLRFEDSNFDVIDSAQMAIGNSLDLAFVTFGESSAVKIFVGEITSVGIEAGPDGFPVAVITGHDLSHRLGRNSRQRVFANQTYGDMVSKIAGENGLRATTSGLTIQFEHITQHVDDAAFITEICRRSGLIWTVDDKTLTLKEAKLGSPAVTLKYGESLLRFRAQFDSAEVVDDVAVRSWDPKTKKEIASKNTSKPGSLSTAPLVTSARSATTSTFKSSKQTGANVTSSVDEARLLASSLHGRSMGDELRVRGETFGNTAIVAGCTIAIAGVGTKLSGNYFVTSADHNYSHRGYTTKFVCGGVHPAKLVDLVAGRASAPGHLSVVVGVVSNVGKDAEAGMVKVKLPSIGDNLESAWARVVTPGGGATRGLQLMPSVDDEVLVVFENGDMRRPFVLGGLWNPKDKMPFPGFVTGSDVTEWTLRDRVGHTLSFRGGSGDNKRNVEVLLADGKTKLFLGQDKVELWANDGKTLQLKSGQGSITITANGDIEIKGTKITITGTQEIAAKATTVKVNADATMLLQAQATLEIKASASAKLDGGGMTEIKGGMVKVN